MFQRQLQQQIRMQSDIKVGISIYKFDDNFMSLYRNELVRYLTGSWYSKRERSSSDGKNDHRAEQTNQINFIATKVDVMILNLVQSSSAANSYRFC